MSGLKTVCVASESSGVCEKTWLRLFVEHSHIILMQIRHFSFLVSSASRKGCESRSGLFSVL